MLKTKVIKLPKHKGFTLIELIIVIIILAIMGISFAKITSNSVYGYIDARDRNKLSQTAQWVSERISREVREALPQSVRTGTSGNFHCVEFMPIVNASSYTNLPASGAISSFQAVGFNLASNNSSLVAIMPIDSASLYSSVGVLGTVASIATSAGDPNQAVITLDAPTNFLGRSPQNRFYLLNQPVSFCLNNANGQILRYANYGVNANQPFPPSNGSIVGENFSVNGAVFNYQAGTLSRSGLLQVNLRLQNRDRTLSGSEESFEVYHEVHIRNVP